MRKADIKPGVVYAYRQPVGTVVPLVFLSAQRWIGSLWRATRGGDRAFVLSSGSHRPQAGNVCNNGSIGYPAVIWPGPQADVRDLDRLLSVSIDNFRVADGIQVPGLPGAEFMVVTATVRVLGPWTEVAERA